LICAAETNVAAAIGAPPTHSPSCPFWEGRLPPRDSTRKQKDKPEIITSDKGKKFAREYYQVSNTHISKWWIE
jgi:hypothetical protein